MAADFDKLAPIYDATRALPEEVMEKVVAEISKALKEHESESILDVGVGTGRFALPLSEKGFGVAGIDISREMLKVARGKRLDKIILADGCYSPFKEKVFDAAVTVHLLHLMSSWKSILREIRRVTRNILVSSGTEFDGLNMRLKYLELRRKYDLSFQERGLENGENSLAQLVRPEKTIMVTEERDSLNMDEEIEYFEKRGSAITLDTPDKAHSEIINVLKSSYSGTTLQRTKKELVYVWTIDSLQKVYRSDF